MSRPRRDDLIDFVRDLYEGHVNVDGSYDWLPFAMMEHDEALRDEAPAREPGLLVDYGGAARLLGTTVSALKTRVSRGDNRLLAAMVLNGRSVRFNVQKLSEKFTPRNRT